VGGGGGVEAADVASGLGGSLWMSRGRAIEEGEAEVVMVGRIGGGAARW